MSRGPSSGVSARLPTRRPPQPLTCQALRTKHRPGAVHRHAVRFTPARRYEEAGGVLKITWLSRKGLGLTIKLEGEILGLGGRRPRGLRCPGPATYVDAAGVQLLRDVMPEGVEIAACSSFVGELLHLES